MQMKKNVLGCMKLSCIQRFLMLWVNVMGTWLLDTGVDTVNPTWHSGLVTHHVRFTFYILLDREIDPPH